MKNNTRISVMLIALHLSALASMLWGQAMSSLRGNITDAQAAAIDGAVVKLESAETRTSPSPRQSSCLGKATACSSGRKLSTPSTM